MIKAEHTDKSSVVAILCKAFDANKSVNFIAKQDDKRLERIKVLMEYSFEMCLLFGEVYLSEDKQGCALLLYPEKKKTTLKSIFWNAKLAWSCIGLSRIMKIIKREALIKRSHPKRSICHLLFLGVHPSNQKKGIGKSLLQSLIQKNSESKLDIYLETSTVENIAWYQQFGFTIIEELNIGYKLYLFKRSYMH